MSNDFNFSEQALHAELANAAYNTDPETGEAGPHNSDNMSQSVHDRFGVRTAYSGQGDVVYTFTERTSGDVYAVGRGTDDAPGDFGFGYTENSQLGDWGQYPGSGLGTGTTLGREMADVATDI